MGILTRREEIEVRVVVLTLKKDGGRGGGWGARRGRRLVWERRMGRRRVVYDI